MCAQDWIALPAMKIDQDITTRAVNSTLVGQDKCRDPDWISLNVDFVDDVVIGRTILNLVPPLMNP